MNNVSSGLTINSDAESDSKLSETEKNEEEKEIFVKIRDFPDYFISNFGTVASTKTGFANYLMPGKNPDGYLYVSLYKNGERKGMFIHRLVAEHFVDNPLNKPLVDHIDRNKLNNKISNLRWATFSENNQNKGAQSNNTSGYPGVSFSKHANKWRSIIDVSNTKKHLGYFTNFDDAVKARKKAELKYFGEFRNSFLDKNETENESELEESSDETNLIKHDRYKEILENELVITNENSDRLSKENLLEIYQKYDFKPVSIETILLGFKQVGLTYKKDLRKDKHKGVFVGVKLKSVE